VSAPFIEMAMRYHFRVSPPGERVKLRILETDREGPVLAATFNGRPRALTATALLRSLVSLPLVTSKIVAAIRWEALRLWIKGPAWRHAPIPTRKRLQYRLGERPALRLYCRRVIRRACGKALWFGEGRI
jgi:DUF1365 family protein